MDDTVKRDLADVREGGGCNGTGTARRGHMSGEEIASQRP